MSIGTRLDNWINDMLVGVGVAANRFLTQLHPMTPVRPAWMDDADGLAEFEAGVDCYEPDDVWGAEHLSENPIYREIQLQHAREQAAGEDLLSKLACAQNQIHDISVKRPFEDTDDFAEPVGEHPDIDPRAVIGKRQQWDGIGGAVTDLDHKNDLLVASINLRIFNKKNDPGLAMLADRLEAASE